MAKSDSLGKDEKIGFPDSNRDRKEELIFRNFLANLPPKVSDPRRNLRAIEGGRHVPFEIKRVCYLYDVPGGETRAGHALGTTRHFIVAASLASTLYNEHDYNREYRNLLRAAGAER